MALRTINPVEIAKSSPRKGERGRASKRNGKREREKTKSQREFAVKLNETKLALRILLM